MNRLFFFYLHHISLLAVGLEIWPAGTYLLDGCDDPINETKLNRLIEDIPKPHI